MKRSPVLSKLAVLTLLAALPLAASAAEGISYNYVEAGYIGTNTDGGTPGCTAGACNGLTFGQGVGACF